jgi:hypothetical protein
MRSTSRAVNGTAADPHSPISPTAVTTAVCPEGLNGGGDGDGPGGVGGGAVGLSGGGGGASGGVDVGDDAAGSDVAAVGVCGLPLQATAKATAAAATIVRLTGANTWGCGKLNAL